jgi:hypothetical protein
MSVLHIHNGDAAAEIARKSSLAGEHLAWRESLVTGPTPGGLSAPGWRRMRAKHLAESYSVTEPECELSLERQEAALASASDHDEVVLWFEHDLFCQLHLLYLLDWFSRCDRGRTTLSLICIGEFPDKANFRGLGELSPEQLASLFPARTKVTSAQTALAATAWHAYCANDPIELTRILEGDTSPTPFLRPALQAHLARFPATRNGLGHIENRALDLVAGGAHSFAEVFARFAGAETTYGLGDSQFWLTLRLLATANKPLLKVSGIELREATPLTPDLIHRAKFAITDLGRAVRNGAGDFVALNGINLWLGGVHLHDRKSLWRWNEASHTLVLGNA